MCDRAASSCGRFVGKERCRCAALSDSTPPRAHDKEHGFGNESIQASDEILFRIASFANGDARTAYNTLELAVRSAKSGLRGHANDHQGTPRRCPAKENSSATTKRRGALQSHLRAGTNPFATPIPTPRSIGSRACSNPAKTRSISRVAWFEWPAKTSASPKPGALAVTLAAKDAFDFLGAPEGHLALAQAAVYLSLAPKSNALYNRLRRRPRRRPKKPKLIPSPPTSATP